MNFIAEMVLENGESTESFQEPAWDFIIRELYYSGGRFIQDLIFPIPSYATVYDGWRS